MLLLDLAQPLVSGKPAQCYAGFFVRKLIYATEPLSGSLCAWSGRGALAALPVQGYKFLDINGGYLIVLNALRKLF